MIFSIIIPTCNRNDLLVSCLQNLHPSIVRPEGITYEVIVTDDSKEYTGESFIKKRFPWVNYLKGPQKGPAANRNYGASRAKGSWLIFIDDDCIPERTIIETYHHAIEENRNIAVFEGCTRANRKQQSFLEEAPLNEKGGFLWSCNFMIERRLFEEMNGFDICFPNPAVEDVEFHYRLQKRNEKIMFVQNAIVIHPWRTQKNIYAVTLKRFDSIKYFLDKHPEKAKDLSPAFYLKITLVSIKSFFTKSIEYKFKGLLGKMIFSMLHCYFAFYLAFRRFNTKKESSSIKS